LAPTYQFHNGITQPQSLLFVIYGKIYVDGYREGIDGIEA
jgi:hypothetical protein